MIVRMHACALGLDLLGFAMGEGVGVGGRYLDVTCSRQMQMQCAALHCAALRCAVPEARLVVVVVVVVVMQTLSAYLCVIDTDTYLPIQSNSTTQMPRTLLTTYTTYATLHYTTHLPPSPHLNKPQPQRNSQSRVHACVRAWAV
jgi:hypothetical protein